MKGLQYHEPRTVEEASLALVYEGSKARVLAGGTDLLVRLKRDRGTGTLVNIKKIPELHGIRINGDYLYIGAVASLSEVESHALVLEHAPVLAKAIILMASWEVRNIATLAGNLCNASPAADTACPLLCLDAEVVAARIRNTRAIPLGDFFVGPGKTSLTPGEIVTAVRIPLKAGARAASFQKLGIRSALDIAIVSVCVSALNGTSRGGDVRIALGSVAPVPMRAVQAEEMAGQSPVDVQRIAETAASECSPIDDIRASRWYRTEMVRVLVRRCLEEIWQ